MSNLVAVQSNRFNITDTHETVIKFTGTVEVSSEGTANGAE